MRLFGLIGYPLSHSFSADYFRLKFKREKMTGCEYRLFEIPDLSPLRDIISKHPSLEGLSVTIPFKEKVLSYLDDIDVEAKKTGAVNAITVRKGKLKGFNTDIPAFMESVKPLLQPGDLRALVLGAGGAAKAVLTVFEKLGISSSLVSRKKGKGTLTWRQVTPEVVKQHQIIINATPLGMYPDAGKCPDIPYEALTPGHLLYDLVYNPEETRFLANGRQHGARLKNGLEMLHLQAEKAWDIWQG